MFKTTALVALGEFLVAPCPECDCLVLLRCRDGAYHAQGVRARRGSGLCRGCGAPLAAEHVRIPDSCRRAPAALTG